jgi:phenylacetate-CoA ligase
MLAQLMIENNESPIHGLKAILCGSENLYEWQREQIKKAFDCHVYSWYGMSEKVCLAGECEYDSRYHIFPEYGYTELLDEQGNPIKEPGIVGEIVGTGFLSICMPLIRYRTMDWASYASGYCGACKRKYHRFERIEGRLQEFIISATDRYVSMVAINMHSPIFDSIRQFRFYQDKPGVVVFKIVPKASYTEKDKYSIQQGLKEKLGNDFKLTIEVVKEIPRTSLAKYRFVEQKLSLRFGE